MRIDLLAAVCLMTVASAQSWVPLTPPVMQNCAMTYDPGRGRALLVGSDVHHSELRTWEHDGSAWHLAEGPAPALSFEFALVHDWSLGRSFLLLPQIPEFWEHSATGWSRNNAPTLPTQRVGTAMAYDITRSSIVLFGGSLSGVTNSDTWIFTGNAWSQLTPPTSPAPRSLHAMAYDFAGQRTLLFGGLDQTGLPLGDTWSFDGSTWTQLAPAQSPPARAGHSLVYDLGRARTILLGPDHWEFDGTNWQQVAVALPMGPAQQAGVAYDLAHARTLLQPVGTAPEAETTWSYDGTSWSHALAPANNIAVAQPAYDALGDRLWVVGRGSSNTVETWEMADLHWQQLFPAHAPHSQLDHALSMDATRRRLVCFGGAFWQGLVPILLGETWEYDGNDWQQVTPPHAPPPRLLPLMVHDPRRGRTVLFGGTTVVNALMHDTWEYDGSDWTPVATPTTPNVQGDAMVLDANRDRVVMLGESYGVGSLWSYDGADWTQTWSAQLAAPAFPARQLLHDPRAGRTFVVDNSGGLWEPSSGTLVAVSGATPSTIVRSWFDARRGCVRAFAPAYSGVAYGRVLELREPDAASWVPYGVGCVGSNGAPTLGAGPGALPRLGSTFVLQLGGLPGSPGLALFAFGTDLVEWNGAALPVALDGAGLPGCAIWLAPAASVLLAHSGGTRTVALPIPALPSLTGLVLGVQAFAFDAAAANGLGAVSNGVVLRIF
jgi:hypothetical protein